MLERKQDVREKIQLGGLVKKAELGDEPKSVILGLLCEAKKQLLGEQGSELRERWRERGDKVFNQTKENRVDAE